MLIDGKQLMSLSNDELGATLQQIAKEMERRYQKTVLVEGYAKLVTVIGTSVRRIPEGM